MDDSGLLVNLAVALAAAFTGAVIAVRLGQSAMLGYILGGIAIGPFTPGFVGNPVAVDELANIGVILLMFTIGMQLSLGDLKQVGRVAVLGGGAQVLLTIGVGYLAGIALGWSWLEALFFGAVLSNSSSTLLSKVLAERGESDSVHGRIGIAWSTIQVLSTIVLVVVLTALGAGGDGLASDLLWATIKAVVFLIVLIPVGTRVLPWLFEQVADLRNREVFVLTVGAVALGTAYVSSLFGLSVALGAFVAGVVVSESDLSHQILGDIEPLRDIFAGLFFLSVGMLVDPGFVLRNLPLLALTVMLIVVAKGVMVGLISLIFRYPPRVALMTGVALAQSAEFSFLLARLGSELDAISGDIFSLMLAGAAVSIVIAPSLHAVGHRAVGWLDQRMPPSGELATLQAPAGSVMRGHAVICGYGRVGRVIGEALQRRGFPMVIIEQDQRIVRELRAEGIEALAGSADHPLMLQRVNLVSARVLIVAVPDALTARRIVDEARRLDPRLDIVVRTHSQSDFRFHQERGVDETVLGELELALEMTRFALHRFGVPVIETQAIVQRLRRRSLE
ncbi:MAG: cation:proton antiporter [Chloroflexota bacterium]|nr:cation:proton antiporter [Chloroflexota bacterium]